MICSVCDKLIKTNTQTYSVLSSVYLREIGGRPKTREQKIKYSSLVLEDANINKKHIIDKVLNNYCECV